MSTLPPLPTDTSGVVRNKTAKKNENKKMEITIHVCDEAKNLKKDFTCSKDLLLSEMKYFQDYLSSDTQAWEDIDISVHCDVKIFDWLIRYVKMDKDHKNNGPTLDGKTAVSILISSEFLKMENLVEECIQYCHDNLSEIIASPCNMNCVNDSLLTRIAACFSQYDLEKVIDKKDKFKSKLFCKKIEELFDPNFSSAHSPNNASNLFKCLHCRKVLLPHIANHLECTVSRTVVDQQGNLRYVHSSDDTWEVSEYLLSLKQTFKTWRMVFWKLWSTINYLECSLCGKIFPLKEYGECCYHPLPPVQQQEQNSDDKSGPVVWIYPCCEHKAILFEPIACNTGCQRKYHSVSFERRSEATITNLFEELLSVLNLVRENEPAPTDTSPYSLGAMIKTELSRLNRYISIVNKEEKYERKRRPPSGGNVSTRKVNKVRLKKDTTEEEDSDIEEPGIVRIVIQHKDTPPSKRDLTKTWNNDLPVRLNQDMQRESDVKRMNDMLKELAITRKKSSMQHLHQGCSSAKTDILDAGLYHRIEQKLRSASQHLSVTSLNSTTNTQFKHMKAR